MPADEVTHGTDVDESRVRTGPRHAAPKKPLFTRFHMPAGKAIASVAMPTAVLMGFGFTSTLAIADTNNTSSASSKSLAEDYKDCVAALDSASPSASASASDDATDSATPSATASSDSQGSTSSGKSSSSDSGSGDAATPTPSASESSSSSGDSGSSGSSDSGSTATPSPSASASSSSGGLLDSIGDAIGSILSGGSTTSSSSSDSTASPSPSASASADSSSSSSSSDKSSSSDSGSSDSGSTSDTVSKTVKTVTDTVKDTTDTATKAADDATKAAADATSSASPSASASSSASADNCEVATDDTSGVDNKVPVADDPWYLSASSLTLKSADYQGIVEVKTASGEKKKVLKYVISGGTDIGDLHQTVKDTNIGKTYHVQAASGSTSTIRNGSTTMYTESISGNLFGLIPITFDVNNPPPLNIPLIYFTNVKVTQAAQFGGTLHIPGMHVYTTDGTG
ncbi:hypothetical protein [Streptomyces sp. GbtcB6]|uniref:hypothetical protein n=1 Tax=Streptomyces sp. GbtcB6 TaxID=2824751 RepID=UPI001C30DB03|nr:hypothetical protein [Streptomyces sp. GbtcB6]